MPRKAAVLNVYALAQGLAALPRGGGVCKERLATASAFGIWAVYGEVDAPSEVSHAALARHDRVVRGVRAASVVPVRFGAVLPDLAALRRLLRTRRGALREVLARVAGCEQFTLRVFVDAAPRPALGEGPGERWLRARSGLPMEIAPLRASVGPFVRSERAEGAAGVASVYHLVARADRRAYRAALEYGLHDVSGARVAVSGPWPPYAFAEAM